MRYALLGAHAYQVLLVWCLQSDGLPDARRQVQSMMKAKEADVSLQAATKASFASPFSPGVGLRPTAVLAKSSLNKRYYAGGR